MVNRYPSGVPRGLYLAAEAQQGAALARAMAPYVRTGSTELLELAVRIVRGATIFRIPIAYMAALIDKESDGVNENNYSGAEGYTQQIPRYADSWWPYELPQDRRRRIDAMVRDPSAQVFAMAKQLRSLAARGAATRGQQGETTYREHALAHADTWRSKGNDPNRQPAVPVRYFRNPWLAMYNRGARGGKWPRLDAPIRADGSRYQVRIEQRAAEIGADLAAVEFARLQPSRASEFDSRWWVWMRSNQT